jgi:alpha-D-ribose 1-methylphosphonate 5-triphosphate diphosphatase
MLRAAFVLAERGVLDLPRAWALIAENPARAAGLADRGVIEAGKRADLVVVDPGTRRAVAVIAGGRVAHLTAEGSLRLSAG